MTVARLVRRLRTIGIDVSTRQLMRPLTAIDIPILSFDEAKARPRMHKHGSLFWFFWTELKAEARLGCVVNLAYQVMGA
jgi:hypothetical protein